MALYGCGADLPVKKSDLPDKQKPSEIIHLLYDNSYPEPPEFYKV